MMMRNRKRKIFLMEFLFAAHELKRLDDASHGRYNAAIHAMNILFDRNIKSPSPTFSFTREKWEN